MADLTEQQKHRIVMALARFEGLTEIVRALGEEGIQSDARQVGGYDPTRSYYDAGERWKSIFDEERKRYLTDVQAVPIANQGFRLNALQRTYEEAVKSKNKVLANQTLRQAAEEVGGALTNERNLKVSKPLTELSADERRAMLAEIIAKALEPPAPPPIDVAPEKRSVQ